MLPVLIVLLLVLSAACRIAERAVFSLSDSRIRTLEDEGFRGAAALAQLRANPVRLLVLLRVGIALGDVGVAGIAGAYAFSILGLMGVVPAILGMTLVVVVFAHILPLRLVSAHTVKLALVLAPALRWATRFLAPALIPLAVLARGASDRPAHAAEGETEHEIRQLTAIGRDEGVIEEHERQLIERAFRLDDTKAWDIMTPRVDIFAWPDSRTLAEIAPELGTVSFSRVPVYGETIDDVTGVLYVRDAYRALISGQRDVPLRDLARQPLIVPGSVPLTKLLQDFQTRRIHLALVVDEYGGTDGLVTLEDVLEELVGEIVDETDVAEEAIQRVSRHEIVAAGDADLREINHLFNAAFPQLEHRSLNGYLLEELGRVPEQGERFEREGITLEILEATETQVIRVRLRRQALAPEPVGHPPAETPAAGGTGETAAAPEPRAAHP